jgi:hypothetical protein
LWDKVWCYWEHHGEHHWEPVRTKWEHAGNNKIQKSLNSTPLLLSHLCPWKEKDGPAWMHVEQSRWVAWKFYS